MMKNNDLFEKLISFVAICIVTISMVSIVNTMGYTTIPDYYSINKIQTSSAKNITDTLVVNMPSTPIIGNILVCVTISKEYFHIYDTKCDNITQTGVIWTNILNFTDLTVDSIWFGVVNSTASKDITLKYNRTGDVGIMAVISEYSGIKTTDYLDKTSTNSTSTNIITSTGVTEITSQDNELLVGGIYAGYVNHTIPRNGYSLYSINGNSTFVGMAYLDKIITTAEIGYSGTTITSSTTSFGGIVTLKGAIIIPSHIQDELGILRIFINILVMIMGMFLINILFKIKPGKGTK
jgi:hypothetical protein